MSVTRLGATKQYSDNWDNIFGGKKNRSSAPAKTVAPARQSAKKQSAKKKRQPKAAKKASRRK
ncbi:MAG: hypothetical protein WD738_01880 [Pirellulales bacterium]